MMSESIRDGYKMTELGEMPEEWKAMGLSQLLSLEYGLGLPERKRTGNGFPVYGSNGIVGFHREYFISSKGIVIGRKGTIGSVTLTEGSFWPIDTTYYIKLKQKSNFYWIYYLLLNLNLDKLDSSTGIPGLNRNDVYNLRVPLPPIPEQHRIAEILSTIDETIERTEALIEKYRHIKAGLMSDLLTRGIDEEGRIRNEETHKFKDSPLGRVPEEWKIVEIKKYISRMKSGLSRRIETKDIGLPVLISGNIQNSKLDTTELKYWYLIDPQGANTSDYYLNSGDILLCFINSIEQIGKCCIFEDIGRKAIYTTNMFRIVKNSNTTSEFLYFLLNSDIVQQEIKCITKPAVNQASFTKPDFKSIKIPFISLPEQHHITEILTTVDTYIEKEQTHLNKLQQIKKGLMQDLLTGKVRVTTTSSPPKPAEAAT